MFSIIIYLSIYWQYNGYQVDYDDDDVVDDYNSENYDDDDGDKNNGDDHFDDEYNKIRNHTCLFLLS